MHAIVHCGTAVIDMDIEKWQSKKFEEIKHFDEEGNEYWLARELQAVLGYTQWRRFCDAIERAMVSCKLNEQEPKYHFADAGKMVVLGSRSERKIEDFRLTRFACYLIVMNGDPRKEPIAQGQMYFAVKTRQQEVLELYGRLDEDGKRLFLRGDIKQKNMLLYETARRAGIQTVYEYAAFTDKGYMGLYGGLRSKDIAERKGIGSGQEILDHMGSIELAANLFRITQTEDVLRKENVTDKETAGRTHYNVGKEVRTTIGRIGGTMPEDLPTPERSIPELQKEKIKAIRSEYE
jgi:DNA-damage-inducible protein D